MGLLFGKSIFMKQWTIIFSSHKNIWHYFFISNMRRPHFFKLKNRFLYFTLLAREKVISRRATSVIKMTAQNDLITFFSRVI